MSCKLNGHSERGASGAAAGVDAAAPGVAEPADGVDDDVAAGNFSVDIAVSSHVPLVCVHALVPGPVSFEVVDSFDGDSARGDYMGDYPGVIRPIVDWTTEYRSIITTESRSLDELAAS